MLRALMLKRQIDGAKKELEALREKEESFAKREAELASDIEEVETAEQEEAVKDEIEKFEAEKAENAEAQKELEERVAGLESELADVESKAEQAVAPEVPVEPEARTKEDYIPMTKRDKMFGSTVQERDALFQREEVQAWIGEVRSAIKEKRALTNVGLTIPKVFLGVLRQNIDQWSKLYKHVNVRQISGDGREVIMGAYPEAVWTEACGILNELDLGFADVEVSSYKLGGFFTVCNAVLEDSDLDLAAELITALGQAIGKALDKAILFGTGTKMPLGFFTRLAQTEQPADYPANARPWVDLHQSNVKVIGASSASEGIALFKSFVKDAAAAKGKYSRGAKVWAMNEKTYTHFKAEAMSVNAAGAIVSGFDGRMPVEGGIVEVLDFIPDDMIFGGYLDLYLLAERSATKFAQSEHYKFVEDKTVIKGTARYDGVPVIAEGFVAIGINNTTPSAGSISFVADDANTVQGITINKTAVSVVKDHTVQLKAVTSPVEGTITWASSDETYATVDTTGKVTGEAAGSATITATCNGVVASCVVTVSAS